MDYSRLKSLLVDSPLCCLNPFFEDTFLKQIRHGDFQRWRLFLQQLPIIRSRTIELGDCVRIGAPSDTDPATLKSLENQLRELIPWRKGPFSLFGIDLDSEWRSQLKWDRVKPGISPLQGRKILDVGCGNGYYSFRMLQAGAQLVIGIDPHIAYMAQFWVIKHFASELPVFVLPLPLEQLPSPLPHFDTVFSMGVLYHRRSPLDHLLQLKCCLRAGGELVLESLYVDGAEGYALTPVEKYARMSNVWFVPSIKTLVRWLLRCGFIDPKIIDESTTTTEEQRRTEWMPFESLQDCLDPSNPPLTLEGYPAPRRVVIVARVPD